jgi:hypothetical protein
MKITRKWLQEEGACKDGTQWFLAQRASSPIAVVSKLIKGGRFRWANWVLVRVLSNTQKVVYAAFAADQVLPVFEKTHPGDPRPRKAIEAAFRFAERPTDETMEAADAAYDAAYNAYVIYANKAATANSATRAMARSSAYAACAAMNASATAAHGASYAVGGADAAANAACAVIEREKVVIFGLSLLKKKEK